jgi:hypothetical protein
MEGVLMFVAFYVFIVLEFDLFRRAFSNGNTEKKSEG